MEIFLANLPFAATESDLLDLFCPFGQVDAARISRDRDSGKSKGFAFILMPNPAEAQRAIAAMQGALYEGRELACNESHPKPRNGNRDSRPGGRDSGASV